MSIIKVNDFAFRAEREDIKIDCVKSSDIYGDAGFLRPKVLQAIRRFESNIKIGNCEKGQMAFSNFNLLDEVELEFIKKQSSKFPYLHFGAILVCVTPLIPNFRRIKGKILLHDASALSIKDGFIAAYEINFEKGPAFFVFRPEHLLSVNDPFLSETLKIALQFDDVNFRQNREVFGVDVGCIYRLSNSARYLCTSDGDGGWAQQEIRGCHALQFSSEIERQFTSQFDFLELTVSDLDVKFKSRGPFLPSRQTRRKKFVCNSGFRPEEVCGRLLRSASIRIDKKLPEEKEDVKCSGRHSISYPPSNRSMALGSTHRPDSSNFGGGDETRSSSSGQNRGGEYSSGPFQEVPIRQHSNIGVFGKDPVAECRDNTPTSDSESGGTECGKGHEVESVCFAPSIRNL
uniref:Movement protein n=1 Tax=Hobart betaflexivirus 1 TaxID=2201305 RepID=A0A2U8JQD4_9VIRU|nr:movement protein [Hobart betaflexivirus 1]